MAFYMTSPMNFLRKWMTVRSLFNLCSSCLWKQKVLSCIFCHVRLKKMIILLVGHYYLSNMRWEYILVQSLFMLVIRMNQMCIFFYFLPWYSSYTMLQQQHEQLWKYSLREQLDLCLEEHYSQLLQQLSWCHLRVLLPTLGTSEDKVLHFCWGYVPVEKYIIVNYYFHFSIYR